MINSFGPLLVSPLASLAWTILWQSTLWLTLGLVVSRLWRGHAARAHLLLVLATVAAVASPLLTIGVRGLGWGFLPAPRVTESAELRLEPTPPIAAPQPPVVEQAEIAVVESMSEQMEPGANSPFERTSLPPAVSSDSTPEAVPPTEATAAWTIRVVSLLPAGFIAAWLLSSLGMAIRVTTSMLAGRRLVRQSVREEHPGLLAALGEARQLLGVFGDVSLRASSVARCPMIWCWGRRPVLLVPPSAGDQSGISWCSIFCHELAHWLRRDHLSALWTELLVIALPWQPLAWLIRRQLSALREQACDDWVLASQQEATDYAESLVNLVPQNSPTFALPALRSYESLKCRLEHVLAGVRVTPRAGRNWIALVSLVSLAAAAGIAFAQQRSQTTNPKGDGETLAANATAADQPGDIYLLPAREENGDVFTVRGRALKADGTPAAGARVSIVRYFFGHLALARSGLVTARTADADGRFVLTYHPSQITSGIGRFEQWRETMVVAESDGCGLQWADWQDIAPDKPLLLKLTLDAPIHGRVIDLEGRPVQGAIVSIRGVDGAQTGTIDPWLNAVKSGADAPAAWRAAKLKALPYFEDGLKPPVKTGSDGRFVLSGIGPDRIVNLAISGDTISHSTITVVTRAMAPITRQLIVGFAPLKDAVFGSDFTFQPSPSRPITGIVRDAATGKPLAGVTIASDIFAGTRLGGIRDVVSQTDVQGRYRLVGMPKGKGNEITAFPSDDQPYLIRDMIVPDDPGAGPVNLDIELHRGVWIEGRVFEKETGKPAIARLHYWPFRNNPFTRGLPEFKGLNVDGDQYRYVTRPDGSFRLVGLPGRAIVGAEAVAASYKLGVGAREIKGAGKDGRFPTYVNPVMPTLNWPNAIKEISPSKEATTVHCDFGLERGDTIRVTLVDRDSKPVIGCTVEGRATGNYLPVPDATFDLENLSRGEIRPIVIEQKERGIGKFLLLKFDEKTPRTMTITLESSATLVGRILDEDGVPLGGTHVVAHPWPGGDLWPRLLAVVCKADGTFKYTGLVPGCEYGVHAEGTQMQFRVIAKRLKVEPGELIDLGDIKFKRNSDDVVTTEPRRKAAKAKSATANVFVHGRVVKPDGQPAVGASVRIIRNPLLPRQWGPFPREEQLASLAADANGEFSAQINLGADRNDQQSIQVWATLPGYGLAVGRWSPATAKAPLALELVEDEPIRGRLIDLQGRPVVDARIVAVRLVDSSKESLDDFLSTMSAQPRYMRVATSDDPAGQRSDRGEAVLRARSDSFCSPTLLPAARTDSQGRFEMKGLGRDRMVRLLVTRPNVEAFSADVFTRPISTIGLTSQKMIGSRFERVVGPSVPIEGIVVDEETRRPVAGAHILPLRVRMPNYLTATDPYLADLVGATSDATGRYRIEGLPSENENWLKVIVPNLPYPTVERVTIPASNSLKPLQYEIKLRRGVWAVGRAFDRVSGKPVAGHVYYTPFRLNKTALNYQRYREQETDYLGNYPFGQADVGGRFRIPVISGRGVIAFQAASGDYRPNFGRAQIKEIADPHQMMQPMQGPTFDRLVPNQSFHSVREINVPRGIAEISVDLPVDSGQNVLLTFVDAAGRRLSGTDAYGSRLASRPFPDRRRSFVEGDSTPVFGTSPDETRTLWFRHRATGLTKLIRFTPKEGETARTIVLEPPGVVTGRFVTPEGTPISGVTLECVFDLQTTDRLPSVDTDSNGHFRQELPAGGPYMFLVSPFPHATIAEKLMIESGERVDLGTITIERDGKEFSNAKVSPGREMRTKTQAAAMPATGASQRDERTTRPTAKHDQLPISGRVLDEKNQPIVGAHVAAISRKNESRRGGDFGASSDVPGEATTGSDGEYQMEIRRVKANEVSYPTLVARADGRALAWKAFNLQAPSLNQPFTLVPESVIRGRFVDLQGQPAAGIHASLDGIIKRGPNGPLQDGVGFRTEGKMPAVWPGAIVSDSNGRFVIHGVGQDCGVFLNIPGSDHFAPQSALLNTGMPERRGPKDATYRPQAVRNLKPGEEAVIALAPAQFVEGQVRFADTELPVPHTRLTIFASQQQMGSASGVAGETDERGHFHITSNPGIHGQVIAYPPHGTPYLIRKSEFDWHAGTTKAQIDVELPRGVLARGKIVESGTNRPIAKASIQYMPEGTVSLPNGVITGWQGIEISDVNGHFSISVLPGPGWLLVHAPTGDYVLNVMGYRELYGRGKGGQRNYAHAFQRIDPRAGSGPIDLSIALTRGMTVTGRVLTSDGQPADNVYIISRLKIAPISPTWRSAHEKIVGDRFTITGCAPGVDYPVYFLQSQRHLGATRVIRAGDSDGTTPDVRLLPCGSARARFVDPEGNPLSGMQLMPELIVTPGPYRYDEVSRKKDELTADADLLPNIDESNWHTPESAADGRVTIGNLIPGATYRVFKGRIVSRNYQDFKAESGQTHDLGDIVIERSAKM